MQDFDLRTEIRNPKTGQVITKQPYRLYARKGGHYFERPKNSGNLWFRGGEAAGRIVDNVIDTSLDHVEWVAPLSHDQKINEVLSSKESKIQELEHQLRDLELKSINQEKDEIIAQAPEVKVEAVIPVKTVQNKGQKQKAN
jgi:hypothetical protein